jgi:hypothetical protein
MKRFYCTICRRIKRVRSLPTNVVRVHADEVKLRTGTCDKHDVGQYGKSNITLRKAN